MSVLFIRLIYGQCTAFLQFLAVNAGSLNSFLHGSGLVSKGTGRIWIASVSVWETYTTRVFRDRWRRRTQCHFSVRLNSHQAQFYMTRTSLLKFVNVTPRMLEVLINFIQRRTPEITKPPLLNGGRRCKKSNSVVLDPRLAHTLNGLLREKIENENFQISCHTGHCQCQTDAKVLVSGSGSRCGNAVLSDYATVELKRLCSLYQIGLFRLTMRVQVRKRRSLVGRWKWQATKVSFELVKSWF